MVLLSSLHGKLRALSSMALVMGLAASPLAATAMARSASAAAPAVTSGSFSVVSSGTPSIAVVPDTGLPPPSGAPDTAGSTNVTTTVQITDTGFSSSDTSFLTLECSDDPSQPGHSYLGLTNFPVACNSALDNSSTPPASYPVISGNVGSGNGATCSTQQGTCDSSGNPPAQDAASFPCPPTPAQQAAGMVCVLVVVGLQGVTASDLAAQPLEFSGEAPPTLQVTGTGVAQAYPGEIVAVSGSGWPISPGSSAPDVPGTVSLCSAGSCEATQITAGQPGISNSNGVLTGGFAVPATPSSGVTYPCGGCSIQFQVTESVSEATVSGTDTATDSAPLSVSASFEPAPTVISVFSPTPTVSAGTQITVAGNAFTGAIAVDFCPHGSVTGCLPGTGLTVFDDQDLQVSAPSGAAANNDVLVVNPVGSSAVTPADQAANYGAPGYWMLEAAGSVHPFGVAPTFADAVGGASGLPAGSAAVGMAATRGGGGYWVASSGGAVAHFGDAPALSPFTPPGGQIVTVAATTDSEGYWLANSAGQIVTAGDAINYGNAPLSLNAPVVDMVPTPDGQGYWMLAGDGGVFTFGDAGFFGSTGNIHLNEPAVAMAPTSDGRGYWFVASDGGIFAFGDATYFGSTYQLNPNVAAGGSNSIAPVNKPVNGIVVTPAGRGYWMVAADGGVFTFGDAGFVGSLGNQTVPSPIVGFTPG